MRKVFTLKEIKLGLFSFVVLLISTISNAQLAERWSTVISSPGSVGSVKNAVMVGSDGNIIASGADRIVKYSPQGDIIWVTDVKIEGAQGDVVPQGLAMAQDQAGNIYVTSVGFFSALAGTQDVFIAKFNSDGQLQWSRTHDASGLDDAAAGIGIDQFENVYVTGTSFIGSSVFNSVEQIHTIKFNGDGVLQWVKTFDGDRGSTSKAKAIAVDFFTGDVYVAGSTFVSKIGDETHLEDFTTIKYNTNGEQQWAALYNGLGGTDDEARAIAIDADGNIITTGVSNETVGDHFPKAIATIKYDRRDGSEIWNKKFGLNQSDGDDDEFFDLVARSIVVDADDNVIITGFESETAENGGNNWLTIKYRKSDGKVLWVKTFNNDDFHPEDIIDFGLDEPFALAVDADNNVIVTGFSRFKPTGNDIFTIKYHGSDGSELGKARFDDGLDGVDETGTGVAIDARGNAYVTGGNGTSFITVSYGVCAIHCPQNIKVSNEPGKCGAVVNFEARTTGDCGPLVFLEGDVPVSSGSFFAVGQHNILVKSESTGETCSFTITVVDDEKPVITQCAAPLTVSCAANVPQPDISLIKATDNCEVVTITHAADVISNQTCANRFTLTRTYKATDSHGNTATCAQVITVNDDVPPQITGFSLSKESLFPPNHTMQDITLNYQVIDNCVNNPPVKITITSNEPVNGTGDGDTDPDWVVIDDHHIQLRAERAATGNGRIYTVTVTADDGCNPPVSVTKQVFVAHNITAPQSGNPFKIGSTVNLAGTFWDKPGNTHTAKWLLDASAAADGNVTEPSGNQNGRITGSYKFNSAGVYKLQMNVTDQIGTTSYVNTNGDLEAIVVIYDPNGGYTYGGGYFDSPAGALVSNLSATGKASYGFAVNYKNTAKPQGETQFEFKAGSFEFNAVNFDYLVINGAMAQFRGTGKITGGQSGIGFILTVTDGALDGTGVDKIRMKIFNKNTGAIIYDNQPGVSDAALPVAAVGTNSTIVVKGNNVNTVAAKTNEQNLLEGKAVDNLEVKASPNPTNNFFTISTNSNSKEEIMLQVFDENGRIMDTRQNIIPGSVIRFGDKYRPGAYYVRIMQGNEHREVKLIKITN